MQKMLVLINHLDIETHISDIAEIAKTHGIVKTYLAKVSPHFESRVRNIISPHRLDMAVQMSDPTTSKYLSQIASSLREKGINCESISTIIVAKKLDDFIKKHDIALVITGDGHSGLLCWHGEHLSWENIKPLYENALAKTKTVLKHRKFEAQHKLRTMPDAVLQFGALFLFWLVLSGHYDLKYILFGIASAALITLISNDLFSAIFHHEDTENNSGLPSVMKFLRFLGYMPWLLYKIITANIQVAGIILNPKMPIDPAILQFNTTIKSKVAQVILANSITLTPGTVTISLDDGKYIVHSLLPSSAQSLAEAEMQNMVGKIFMERKEERPDMLRVHSIKELEQ